MPLGFSLASDLFCQLLSKHLGDSDQWSHLKERAGGKVDEVSQQSVNPQSDNRSTHIDKRSPDVPTTAQGR